MAAAAATACSFQRINQSPADNEIFRPICFSCRAHGSVMRYTEALYERYIYIPRRLGKVAYCC